jgi:hypothetical protein
MRSLCAGDALDPPLWSSCKLGLSGSLGRGALQDTSARELHASPGERDL